MWHFLMPMVARVCDGAEPILDPDDFADFGNGFHKADLLFGTCLHREMVKAHIRALGDHKHVDRRLGRNVFESKSVLVLVNGLVRDFTAQDFRENVLIVVSKRQRRPQS